MQQIRQRPQGRDRAGVIAAGRLGVRPRGRDQRLAAVGQLQQQLHHPVPSHPTQHPQRPVMQRMTNSRDRHRRREVLEAGSKSGLRFTSSTTAPRSLASYRVSGTPVSAVGRMGRSEHRRGFRVHSQSIHHPYGAGPGILRRLGAASSPSCRQGREGRGQPGGRVRCGLCRASDINIGRRFVRALRRS